MVSEKITAFGHKNILGTHKTTIELTKEFEVTKRGDCIIGINASKACADLSKKLKKELKQNKKFIIILRASGLKEKITGYGSPELKLTNSRDIVIRKSGYIDDRTFLIKCDKACADLSRAFINKLKKPNQELEFIISELI